MPLWVSGLWTIILNTRMSSSKVYNWGIVGTGRIAADFLGALKSVESA